jgi:hypothetical protein
MVAIGQHFLGDGLAKSIKKGTFALPKRLRHFAESRAGKEAAKFLAQSEIKIWKVRKKQYLCTPKRRNAPNGTEKMLRLELRNVMACLVLGSTASGLASRITRYLVAHG